MIEFLSKFALSCTPYVAGEQPRDKRYVKLNTNENPYPPAPKVGEVLRGVNAEELRKYPDPESSKLKEAIAKVKGVTPDCVYVGNGSDEVLALCYPAFFDRGERVAFLSPSYSFYPVFAEFFGVETVKVPLQNGFADLDALRQADAKGIILCNPNAPTGTAVKKADIKKLLEALPERLVIVDQAYVDFCSESVVEYVKEFPNLLVVETFSKGYGLAGMRLGYAVGNPHLIDGLKRMRDSFNSYPVDRVAEATGVAALESLDYYRAKNGEVVAEREKFSRWLEEKKIAFSPSSSNFVFVNVGEGERVYRTLKENGVLVRYFSAHPNHLRITVGTPEEMEILKRELEKCL